MAHDAQIAGVTGPASLDLHGIVRKTLVMELKVDVGQGWYVSHRMARVALDTGAISPAPGADQCGLIRMRS